MNEYASLCAGRKMLTGPQNLIVEIGQRNDTRAESAQNGFFFLPIQNFFFVLFFFLFSEEPVSQIIWGTQWTIDFSRASYHCSACG